MNIFGRDLKLHSRRASVKRREADTHILALHPELFFTLLPVIHGKDHAGTAGAAFGDAPLGRVVPGGGSKIFHELLKRVGTTWLRVGTSEHMVGRFVVL